MDAPSNSQDESSVRVALRIRPQIAREKLEMSRICTSVTPGEPQVLLGTDRAFTYDHVYDLPTKQQIVYGGCVEHLVEGAFEGYNATVFAYGQTGSGKTYTMGTGFDLNVGEEELGIVPRSVVHLFRGIERRKQDAVEGGQAEPVFEVQVQFIELYNEEIVDLLDPNGESEIKNRRGLIKIHEDHTGEIYLNGVTSVTVKSAKETMLVLKNGALSRTTASTNMNQQSSRSHAIFSLHIRHQRVTRFENAPQPEGGGSSPDSGLSSSMPDFELLSAKFHFVDLAGSERLKRTGATGDRAKEGISINCGLLALGNVISALGDTSKKVTHVPYRDSKLTRLLQDSLGGNSRTLMIACISPSDCDFVETLNTLKYANRARNIKNRVVVNQDKTSKLIGELRIQIQQLQAELLDYKQGKRIVSADGSETVNDQYHENVLLQSEVNQLRVRVKALQETVDTIKMRNVHLLSQQHLAQFNRAQLGVSNGESPSNDPMAEAIQKYLEEIEQLRSNLLESQATSDHLRRQLSKHKSLTHPNPLLSPTSPTLFTSCIEPLSSEGMEQSVMAQSVQSTTLVEEAKADIQRLKDRSVKINTLRRKRRRLNAEELKDELATSDYNTEEAGGDEGDESTSSEDAEMSGEESDADEETETEQEDENAKCRQDLAELQTEISIKERLVEELEHSHARMRSMQMQYEQKLRELEARINDTENERDKIITEIESRAPDKQSKEQIAKIKCDYEQKLSGMKSKLKQVQNLEREHQRSMRVQETERQRMQKLQSELSEMKKLKVQLMQRMKDESKRAADAEKDKNKQIQQMKKEARKRDHMIVELQNRDRQKEAFLKRKQEELAALKQQQKQVKQQRSQPQSTRSHRVLPLSKSALNVRSAPPFSPKAAKQRWNSLEKWISREITQKQTVSQMEQQLERLMLQRENLCKARTETQQRYDAAPFNQKEAHFDELEGIKSNLDYVQAEIQDCQQQIMQVDESTKDSGTSETDTDSSMAERLLDKCQNVSEAKYLLQHLYSLCVEQGLSAANATVQLKEKTAALSELEKQTRVNEMLFREVLTASGDMFGLSDNLLTVPSQCSNSKLPTPCSPDLNSTRSLTSSEKARRRTATPDELLYPLSEEDTITVATLDTVVEEGSRTRDCSPRGSKELLNADWSSTTSSGGDTPIPVRLAPPTPPKPKLSNGQLRTFAPSDHVQFRRAAANGAPSGGDWSDWRRSLRSRAQPGANNRHTEPAAQSSLTRQTHSSTNLQASFTRNGVLRSTIGALRKATNNAKPVVESCIMSSSCPDKTSPQSPRRRMHDATRSVFARLMGTAEQENEAEKIQVGEIKPYRGRTDTSHPLSCCFTAEGHSKPVLAVDANERWMASGSKDRTSKIWDLERCEELCSLGPHPNNVNCVRLVDRNTLFTVSMAQVRVWDLRDRRCVKTLSSSGLTIDGEAVPDTPSRQNTVGAGECSVNAIDLAPDQTYLLTAAGNQVRLWDLRRHASVGKLVGATLQPRSEVSALASVKGFEEDLVVTGSRDHHITLYRLNNEQRSGIIESSCRLEPPHYDGITCLTWCQQNSNWLFSASRDQNLMKWDVSEGKRMQMIPKAHRQWILGMNLLPSPYTGILATACREGHLKLWDTDSCALLGEIRAHGDAINCLAANKRHLFTASSDGSIGFWKPRADRLLSLDV